MFQVKCIGKIRDKNNHIIEYKIIDNNKNTTQLKSDELKEAIKSGQIKVINLTLTSDNELIDKKSDTTSKQINNMEGLLNRVKSIGYILNTFDTSCGHKYYIASSPDNTKHIFIIPDDVKYIYGMLDQQNGIGNNKLYNYMSNIKGELKVIGGKNLVITHSMFYKCTAQYLDLASFDTSNVTNMSGMFGKCEAQSIDLSSFNTSNVTDMNHMFDWCTTRSLDLSSFNTSNVTNMSGMFGYCKAQSIDLSSFNTSKVTDMSSMFESCSAQSLDLSSFDAHNATDTDRMFIRCAAQIKITDPELKSQLQKDRR